jgi:hypothetical protein
MAQNKSIWANIIGKLGLGPSVQPVAPVKNKESLMQKIGIVAPVKPIPQANGAIMPGALPGEIKPKISQQHLFYGNQGNSASAMARHQAALRARAENILRNAYDENKKAFRTTCVDPSQEVF